MGDRRDRTAQSHAATDQVERLVERQLRVMEKQRQLMRSIGAVESVTADVASDSPPESSSSAPLWPIEEAPGSAGEPVRVGTLGETFAVASASQHRAHRIT